MAKSEDLVKKTAEKSLEKNEGDEIREAISREQNEIGELNEMAAEGSGTIDSKIIEMPENDPAKKTFSSEANKINQDLEQTKKDFTDATEHIENNVGGPSEEIVAKTAHPDFIDSKESGAPVENNSDISNRTESSGETDSFEVMAKNIKVKIENEEKLSPEEEECLFNRSEQIMNRETISKEDENVLLLGVEAFNKGLTHRGAEMDTMIQNYTPEIKAFKEKSEEEKDAEINERLEKIKNSGIDLGSDIEEAKTRLDELKEQLKKKNDEFAAMEKDIEMIKDAEGVDSEVARNLIKTISSLKDIYTNTLHIEYYEYWIAHLEKGGIKNLYDSHAERNISMNNWEKLSGDLSSDLEAMKKGEEEVLRKWAEYIKKHPKTGLLLLAAAIAAGIALSPYLAKMLAVDKAALSGISLASPAAKAMLMSGIKTLGSFAALAGKTAGLAGLFLMLTNSKTIDNTMEKVWGKKIPSWAYWGQKRDDKK